MTVYDYWNICTHKVISKYRSLMKEAHVVLSDVDIGCKCCYVYKTLELERRCAEATKIFNNLHKEIDKFPKGYRGIIYTNLKKFRL